LTGAVLHCTYHCAFKNISGEQETLDRENKDKWDTMANWWGNWQTVNG